MADDERERSDDVGDLWSAAFDPAANLRVLGDIQRRGLRAAGEIVERLVAAVDGPPPSGERSEGSGAGPSAADLGAGVDLWVEMAKRSLDVVARLATAAGVRPQPEKPPTLVDVEGKGEQEAIELRVHRSGTGSGSGSDSGGTTEVWLHNGTQQARSDLRLHCGELRSADGGVLPAGLAFDPEVVAELPARSSRGITVGVAPWEGTAEPGTYRGIVMVTGLADVWLPVTVVVEP
jgi:hypothetical protein